VTTAAGPAGRTGRSTPVVESTSLVGSYVSLTFDDGPHPVHTPHLLTVLREHGVTAVFCLSGRQALAHPEIVRAIAADGHLLGNHGMDHDDMGDWPEARIQDDLERTTAAIRAAAPTTPVPFFRAPYGRWGRTPEVAGRLGMRALGWRLSAADWEEPDTDELVRRLVSGVTPGAVVLLHDGGGDRSRTVAAVDRLIPRLTARGWHFTTPARRV
jgi:peptidoglycan/xylan/chitin deacetylase (PgdA/CDA1 family)